jgi:hypothetical protein
MINLFENMPNLSSLTFDIWPNYLNGYEWEEIIRKNLPKIQRFRLRMYFQFSHDNNRQKQIEELFRTRFRQAFLYTLPYAFDRFYFYSEYCFISTCPNEKDYWISNSIRFLEDNIIRKIQPIKV